MMLGEKKETWQDIQADASKDGHSEPLQETKDNAESDSAVVADDEDRTSFFVWLLVTCSSISGLLFGTSSVQFHSNFWSTITYMLHTAINVCGAVNRL